MNRYYLTAEQTGQRDVQPRPFFIDDRPDVSWLDHDHLAWQENPWPESHGGPLPYPGHGPLAADYPAADLYGDYEDVPRRPARHDWQREWPGQALREFFDWGDHRQRFQRRAGARAHAEIPDHRGRGPKGYRRSDESITEEICERLSDDPYIDASDISVASRDGVVALAGRVDERPIKHRVEDIVADCAGVTAIRNELRVDRLHPRSGEDTDNPLRR